MADFRYFADIEGQPVQLTGIWHHSERGRKANAFSGLTPAGQRIEASRMIEYKPSPSRHKCDTRCMHATGRVMRCECACGGANHGRGARA